MIPKAIAVYGDRLGLVALPAIGLVLGLGDAAFGVYPTDAGLFWRAGHAAAYYGTRWGEGGAFYIYPPPLAQVLGLLPWELFIITWMTFLFACFWAATRWWSLPVLAVSGVTAFLTAFQGPVADPVAFTVIGNPQVVVAAICVIGFRYPAAWAFVFLTKIAPGIGILWFAFRREWRSFWIAIGVTAVLAGISFILAPGQWLDYVRFAFANADVPSPVPFVPVPFIVRLPMSLALLWWGARTDRRWTLPLAVGWVSLALYQWSYVAVWMAALPLAFAPRDRSGAPGSSDEVAPATISVGPVLSSGR